MDFSKAGMLLHIAELSLKWPHLTWLHDAAMAEIERLKPIPATPVATGTIPRTPTARAIPAAVERDDG